ncbi:MAG: outer membrane protein assembly factor BamE [Moraxella sp.]|nr:outer membrane protein assembly factor BamE [Moraxella sp.]
MQLFVKLIAVSAFIATLSACNVLRVYTIDLPQGTPITQDTARQVQLGMNQDQVLYLLGSPAFKDALSPARWDYIYDYKAGTDGRRAGKADIKNASQYLSIYFGADGRVTRIDGIDTLPASQH